MTTENAGTPPDPHPGIEVIEVDIDKVHMVQGQLNLAPALRAQIALGSSKTEAALVALVGKHKDITEIKDKAGREQAHGAAMELMRTRTTIADLSKKARDDATKFSKAVIAEETRLIAIIEPEEKRLKALRDGWDEEQERIKREKAEAERKRLLAIGERITEIKGYAPLAQQCRTSEGVKRLIERLEALAIEGFDEFESDAAMAKSVALETMGTILSSKQDTEAEAARLAAERAEQERVRLEQEARQRQLDEQTAEIARQQKALQEAQAAQAAAFSDAATTGTGVLKQTVSADGQVATDHVPAADAAILTATAQTLLPADQGGDAGPVVTHAHTPTPVVDQKPAPVVHKPARPTDDEIIDALALHYRVHESTVIEWLLEMDLQAASERMAREFA